MCFRPTDVSTADKPNICPSCNNENAPGEPKCIFCGAELSVSEAGEELTPPAAPKAPGNMGNS